MAHFAQASREQRRCLPVGAGWRAATPAADEWLLWSSAPYRDIRQWAADDLMVEAEAGLSVPELNQVLAARGQWLPAGMPDGGPDTLGGLVGAGATGAWTGGYGPVRDRVLAMSVATPAYGVVRIGAPVVKNVAGYNLPRLYWGTGAVWGIVLAVTWKLAPWPRAVAVCETRWGHAEMEAALAEADRCRRAVPVWASLVLTGKEDGWTLTGVFHGGPAAAERVCGVVDARLASAGDIMGSEAFSAKVEWQARVPVTHVPPVLQGVRARGWDVAAELQSGVIWGSGAGHDPDDMSWLARWVRACGGVLRPFGRPPESLRVSGSDAALWRRLKAAVDPEGILPPLAGAGEGSP